MKVLITGTTHGLGANILEYMINKGYDVYTINRSTTRVDNIKNFVCDLSNINQTKNVLNLIKEIDFDIIINNAGSGKVSKIDQLTYEDIISEITLNFITPLLLIKEFYPKMIQKKYSRIINISSISAKQGTPFLYVYSASKAALNSLTQSVALTQASEGFTINSICPGGVDTTMSINGRSKISILKQFNPEKYQNDMINSMKTKRLIYKEEVINVIDFLMNPKSSVINGQCINICGTMEVK